MHAQRFRLSRFLIVAPLSAVLVFLASPAQATHGATLCDGGVQSPMPVAGSGIMAPGGVVAQGIVGVEGDIVTAVVGSVKLHHADVQWKLKDQATGDVWKFGTAVELMVPVFETSPYDALCLEITTNAPDPRPYWFALGVLEDDL